MVGGSGRWCVGGNGGCVGMYVGGNKCVCGEMGMGQWNVGIGVWWCGGTL